MVHLDYVTRDDARKSFYGIENVPNKAITMGINTILKSKRIVLLAWGQNKSKALINTIEGQLHSNVPASYLQTHNNTTFVIDKIEASELTKSKTPWKVGSCRWTKTESRHMVVRINKKSILNLTESDYNENNLSELLFHQSPYDVNLEIYRKIHRSITGWPIEANNADDTHRPEGEAS